MRAQLLLFAATPCLPAGRAPGLDASGRGVWDPKLAVPQPSEPGRVDAPLWNPYSGFAVLP